jgi:hypothetical protein
MSTADILHALDLPIGSRVDQRIPKSLLVDKGAPTSADKRLISEGVERLQWHAAIKPSTSGVPEYRDVARHYVEIAVLELILRPRARVDRLVELTHRAVPYPVVLVTDSSGTTSLSMAHKRWSQGEADRVVLDGAVVTAQPYLTDDMATTAAFLDFLAIGRQPQGSLHALYQGWIDAVLALQAAVHTGTFQITSSDELASARRDALRECATIEAEMSSLRSSAIKTTQVARRAEINLELQRLKSRHAAARAKL